jgi:putative transposase
MKKSRFTESQIVKALKEEESGRSASDISRELGINKQTFYNWKKKYAGMNGENRRLKQMYADAALDNKMLKDVLLKKW